MKTERQSWAILVTGGLSLVRYLEQNLDDKELAVVLDGWVHWARSNNTEGDVETKIANVFNNYTKSLLRTQDEKALAGWVRVCRSLQGTGISFGGLMKNVWLDKKEERADEIARKITFVVRQKTIEELRRFLEFGDYFDKVEQEMFRQAEVENNP